MSTSVTDGTTTVDSVLLLGWDSTRDSNNVIHPIINRPDVEVTLRAAGLRRGQLKYFFADIETALAAEHLHALAAQLTMIWTDRPELNMTYAVDGQIGLSLDPETRTRWIVTVDFQELAT